METLSKLNLVFVLFITILFCRFAIAQNLPDYAERQFNPLQDSTKKIQNLPLETGDESVDPDEYVVGAGDRFFIAISGLQDVSYNTIINQNGFLFVPKVGGVDLMNLTLNNAKEKITAAINKYFKNVDVFISLVGIRKITVSLLGDVKDPSSFVLPGNSRLMDLIGKSTGLTVTSDYRNIKIKSQDGTSKVYDFLRYLRLSDRKDNPLLREGDAVIVDKIDKIVSIKGEVKYPGVYEYVPGETAADLIKLAGGFLSKARTDTIEIVDFKPGGKLQESEYYSYDELVNENIILKDNDMILVRRIPQYLIPRYVKVEGWVKFPGEYKIMQDKTTLVDIINEAGGFLKDASLTDATLTRNVDTVENDPQFERLKSMQRKDMTDDEYGYFKAKSLQRKGKVVVDFNALFRGHDLLENVVLKKGDVINVPEAKNYIIMLGQVVNPGSIIYQKKLSVDDYIRMAGGYGWRADKGSVRVIKANTGEWIKADKVDSLSPGDAIWVPEELPAAKFWDVFTTSLQIVGQLAAIVAATVAIIVATRR